MRKVTKHTSKFCRMYDFNRRVIFKKYPDVWRNCVSEYSLEGEEGEMQS